MRKFVFVALVLALVAFAISGRNVSASGVNNPGGGGGSLQQAYNLGQTITIDGTKAGITIFADRTDSYRSLTIDLTPDQLAEALQVIDPSKGYTTLYGGVAEIQRLQGSDFNLYLDPPSGTEPVGIVANSGSSDLLLGPGSAAALTSRSTTTYGAFAPVTSSAVFLGRPSNGFSRLYMDYTNTATVGAVTINKPAGRVNIGAGLGLVTVTNDNVTTASHIFLNADSAPGNVVAVMFYAVAGTGSFTVNAVPAVTNQTAVDFFVVNAN